MSLYSSLTQVLAPFAAKINGLLTGWDGTRYSTPGEAVRRQITDLHVLIGDEPGTAIQASAVAYGNSNVAAELTDVNGRLGGLEDFTLSETTRTIESVITVQAGTVIPSSRHVFDPVNIHEDTLYKLYFEDSDNILGKFTIYANGAAIKSNCITNTEYSFTASADVTYLSIYCQNTQALESGTVTARLSVVTKNENSLEEQIGHISDALQLVGSRNLAEYDWAQAVLSNYEYTPSQYHKNTSMYYTPVIGGEYYTITWGDAVNTSTTLSVYEYDENKTYLKITRAQYSKHSLTLQLDNETAFIILNIYGSTETLWTNLVPEWTQIEKGIYATEYVKPQVINNRGIDEVDLYARMVNSKCFESSTNVPEYYFEGGYLIDKANTINALAQSCAANGDVFAFVTDEHWDGNQKNSHSLIKYLDFQCHIPRLFSGGDIANYDNIRGEFANSLRSNYRNRIYHIAGNHDWFSPATVNSIYYALNMYSHDIHGVPGHTYYYADNDAMRIRYIILNAFTRPDGSTSVTTGYDTAQLEWLNTVLTSTPDNYDIIIFTHYCGLITPSPTGAGYFRNALDAFNAGSHTGKVLAIIQGHAHFDAVNHTTGGIPIITTTCDKNSPFIKDGVNQEPWFESQRISGTITEQAFDIMVLNRTARTITAVRIGALATDNTDLNAGDDGWTYTGTLEQRVITY